MHNCHYFRFYNCRLSVVSINFFRPIIGQTSLIPQRKNRSSQRYLDFCIRLHVSIFHFTRFYRWVLEPTVIKIVRIRQYQIRLSLQNLFCLLQLIQKTKSTINRCPTQKKDNWVVPSERFQVCIFHLDCRWLSFF